MHFLIQGPPSSGKTTLIKNLIPLIGSAAGFYTEQILDTQGKRVGFKAVTLKGTQCVLAHKDYTTPHKVGNYSVDIEQFETQILPELEQSLSQETSFVILDEIGKMELLSESFKNLCRKLFSKKNILATIPSLPLLFITRLLASFSEICIVEVTHERHNHAYDILSLGITHRPVSQLRVLEKCARKIGLSETMLIENASSNLSEIIRSLPLGKNAVFFAGKGNNGADTLSCARKLHAYGYTITVILVHETQANTECTFQTKLLEAMGCTLTYITNKNDLQKIPALLAPCDFIVDGMLGIGARGQVSSLLNGVFTKINDSTKPVVACDIPSGLDPESGVILGNAVTAQYTVSFIAPKKGFFLNNGPALCGKIIVTNIGISTTLLEKLALN